MRRVTAGLEDALAAAGPAGPGVTALARARARIGERPLESLSGGCARRCRPGRAPWSHLGGLLVVAVDGTAISV